MAVLKIYDDIVPASGQLANVRVNGTPGISVADVEQFISGMSPDDDEIDLRINSVGGSVSEGWAIHDKLRATGKKITATIEGYCASMASIVLLAASERYGYAHASLLIHYPYVPEMYDVRPTELRAAADHLESLGGEMLEYYVERTGAKKEILADLMAKEKPLSMGEAKELGFISAIIPPVSATLNKKNMSKKEKMNSIMASIRELLLGTVSLELKTATDGTIIVERESGEPQVGDKASPDGAHKMPNGETIVVENGEIVEIQAPEAPEEPDEGPVSEEPNGVELENEALKSKIAELEKKIEELEGTQPSAEEQEIIQTVAKYGGKAWLQTVASTYMPEKSDFEKEKTPEMSVGALELHERLEKARKIII